MMSVHTENLKKNIFLFLIFLTHIANSQYSEVFSLKNISAPATDFYHITNFGNTEKKSIPFIAQDSIGQMWFATKDGLIRYDSKRFYTYKFDPKNSNSIGGNFVERILVGHDGTVWIGTEPGILAKYRPQTDDFERIEGITGKRIKDIKQDNSGLYWITSNKQLFSYNDQTKELNTYNYSDKIVGLNRLLITREQHIFITTNENFILEFLKNKKQFKKVNILPKEEVFTNHDTTHHSAYYIEEDKQGYIWITTPYAYLLRYDTKTEKISKFPFDNLKNTKTLDKGYQLTIMFLFEDNEQQLWFGTWFNGMYKLNKERNVVTHYYPGSDNPNSLTNNIIHSGFQDKAGYLWFGTEFAGLNILKKNKKFNIIHYNNQSQLPNVFTSSVKDKNNTVWVVDYIKGLYAFDEKHPKTIHSMNNIFDFPKGTLFYNLLIDTNNNLWVSTLNGVYRYNIENHSRTHFTHNKDDYNSITSNIVVVTIEDQNKNIWIGTNTGLNKYNPITKKIIRFKHSEDNPKSLSNNTITSLFCDTSNNIWVGTFRGLNKLNKETGNFEIFKHDYSNEFSLAENRINSITGDKNYLWVGTSSGLNRFDYKTQKFTLFTKENGLPNDYIKSLLIDNKGLLWVTTPHNLVKIKTDNFEITTYNKSDGLENKAYIDDLGEQEFQFSSKHAHKDNKGKLYFGGINGMIIFQPDSLPTNHYRPPVKLESFFVNGKKQLINSLESSNFKNKQNNFKFSTIILNYIQPEKNQYAFFLDGYDKEWQYTKTNNTIEYFDLPPGNYHFKFKGANNDGIWSDIQQLPIITIAPPFYKTTTFYILVIVFIIMLISSFIYYKIYIKRQLAKQKEKLRYHSSTLNKETAKNIEEKLHNTILKKKLYLEYDLTLHKLAQSIDEKPHHVSQVINQIYGKRFSDYINTYRVDEAKKLLTETYLKIEAVAYDSGFNSLSTFNTAFKKETGITPSKYRKIHT